MWKTVRMLQILFYFCLLDVAILQGPARPPLRFPMRGMPVPGMQSDLRRELQRQMARMMRGLRGPFPGSRTGFPDPIDNMIPRDPRFDPTARGRIAGADRRIQGRVDVRDRNSARDPAQRFSVIERRTFTSRRSGSDPPVSFSTQRRSFVGPLNRDVSVRNGREFQDQQSMRRFQTNGMQNSNQRRNNGDPIPNRNSFSKDVNTIREISAQTPSSQWPNVVDRFGNAIVRPSNGNSGNSRTFRQTTFTSSGQNTGDKGTPTVTRTTTFIGPELPSPTPGSSFITNGFTNPFSTVNDSVFSSFGSPFPSIGSSFFSTWTSSIGNTKDSNTKSMPTNTAASSGSSGSGSSTTWFGATSKKSGATDKADTTNVIGGDGVVSFTGSSFGSSTNGFMTTPSPSSSKGTFSGGVTLSNSLSCSEEFRKLKGHTLCMTDDLRVVNSGVSADTASEITNIHNRMRSQVQPPAEDLVKLKWDDRLATVAEKWAKQCNLGHDTERQIPEIGMPIGQNVAVGYRKWSDAIQTWYDEIKMYKYGFDPDSYLGLGGWREIAHFTQIVQNVTYLIGCGYAECKNTPFIRYYVCNYASGQSNLAYPYTAGSRCGSCPNNCNNGLCDCGNMLCYNKGKLDPSTCSCTCPKPYAGRLCELLDCPKEDKWVCGRDWPPNFCKIYTNVKEECPHMCGLCHGAGGGSGEPVQNTTTFISDFGCVYSGKRSKADECRKYGDEGKDMVVCASEGGNMRCNECSRYYNIKRDYCPVMCGLCDPPCGGKKCKNKGDLDSKTCKCTCKPPYKGDVCDEADCPAGGDPSFCRFWPENYCKVYYNVPQECPYKCGICRKQPSAPIKNPPPPIIPSSETPSNKASS